MNSSASSTPPPTHGQDHRRILDCRDAVVFRAAQEADSAVIHLVWTRAIKATHRFLSLATFEELSMDMKGRCTRADRFVLAECADLVLGFVELGDRRIEAVCVDPLVSRQGIGSRLVRLVRDRYSVLEIAIHKENRVGTCFLAHLGFEEVSGQDEVIDLPYAARLLRLRPASTKAG